MTLTKLKNDLPASIVVFLVALPLCLGVALASGAPLLSGIIAGIIGGIVVGILSESHASVSGPAAGLAAVVLAAITKLGSFEIFLAAVVVAGAIQLLAGLFKVGFIANFIPTNVIKGLLAAIGIILILKQIPHAFGYDKDNEDDFSFFQADGENTFSELINMLNYFSYGAIIISSISLLVLIYWDKTPMHQLKFFPSSLFVVVFGVATNQFFEAFIPQLTVGSDHLVNIPKFESMGALITTPDLKSLANSQVWVVGITIAIVASIETLLNLEAVENVDPHKRQASPNKELVAQGIGNILAGFLGGIPVTSVIVRSSVNLNAGAQSKASAILHGLFLLLSIVLLSPLMNLIPLASLASILLVTGYKLAKVSLFKDMYKNGLNQFIPFVITVLAIVFTDLLIGVIIGSLISIFYILKSNFKNAYHFKMETFHTGDVITIKLSEEVSFLNKASIKELLAKEIPPNSKVIIDGTNSKYIDFDVLETIKDFVQIQAKEKNIEAEVIGLKKYYGYELINNVEAHPSNQ
ncbi:MAG: SulP family inorganic anion transporter [bacterium]|nr:SulP family inorganic anion transporter [bacterium]